MVYRYETLIENLMDPAHVNFAHHKIQVSNASYPCIPMSENNFEWDKIDKAPEWAADNFLNSRVYGVLTP